MRHFVIVSVFLVASCAAGCGGQQGKVHGTIRYKGQPLTNATIFFIASDNHSYPVRLKSDGTYQSPSLPRGHVSVSIQADLEKVAPAPNPGSGSRREDPIAMAKMMEEDKGKQARKLATEGGNNQGATASGFPATYNDPAQSGLGFELDTDDKDYSLDLN